MSKPVDLSGKSFDRLTVVSRSQNTKHGKATWLCKCECGNSITVISGNLMTGATRSCGCVRKETASENASKGGITLHPYYSVWRGMKARCYIRSNPSFPYYGAKGIKVCDRWMASFWDFASDMGDRPTDGNNTPYDIDRIDPTKDYEPSNCRWLSKSDNYTLSANRRWERVRNKN